MLGNADASTIETVVRRLVGHADTGPSDVADQSNERQRYAISLDPANTTASINCSEVAPTRSALGVDVDA